MSCTCGLPSEIDFWCEHRYCNKCYYESFSSYLDNLVFSLLNNNKDISKYSEFGCPQKCEISTYLISPYVLVNIIQNQTDIDPYTSYLHQTIIRLCEFYLSGVETRFGQCRNCGYPEIDNGVYRQCGCDRELCDTFKNLSSCFRDRNGIPNEKMQAVISLKNRNRNEHNEMRSMEVDHPQINEKNISNSEIIDRDPNSHFKVAQEMDMRKEQSMLEEKRNLEEESNLEYQRILNEQNRLNERNMRDMQIKIEEGNRLEEQRLLNEQRVIEEQRIFEEKKRKAEQRRIEEQRIFEEEKRKVEQRRIEEQARLESQRSFEQQRKLEENKKNPKPYGIWTELESMIKRQLGSHSSLSGFTALYDQLPHNQFYGNYPNDYKKFLVSTSSLRSISNRRISLKVSKNSQLAIIQASIQGEDPSAIILKASNSYIIIFLLEVR